TSRLSPLSLHDALPILEGAALQCGGTLRACSGETDLLIGPGYRTRATDGLLTGVHEKSQSHYALLHAFAGGDLLERASAHAEARSEEHTSELQSLRHLV